MTLDEILKRFAADAESNVVGPPATDQDLDEVDRAVGRPLPPSFRAFLARFGGGLIHLLDLRAAEQPERVVSLPQGSTYTDFATFLQSAVLPPAPPATG